MHRSKIKKDKLNMYLKKSTSDIIYDVFKGTLLTEKTTQLELTQNTMCFKVADWADKKLIREFVYKIFGVEAISTRIINTKSKDKTFQGKKFRKSTYKKAIVKVTSMKVASINFNNFLNKGENNEK